MHVTRFIKLCKDTSFCGCWKETKNFLALAPFFMLNDINLTFQIGSYFGAELCSLDIDSDGHTDFLLVGAPLFFQEKEKREGHIYVYTLTDKVGSYSNGVTVRY